MLAPFSKLNDFIERTEVIGCFADTTVIFSASYPLDYFNEQCELAIECLSANGVPLFSNVNVRAEFLENHRRILIPECLVDFLDDMAGDLHGPLLEKLKALRTNFRNRLSEGKSVKMDPNQIKMFRRLLREHSSPAGNGWDVFCEIYLHDRLVPVWEDAERELNLSFITLRSGDEGQFLIESPEWGRAVEIMGKYGIASADAMILNMFLCSTIPVLLTTDMELAECAAKESKNTKHIFVPDPAIG